MHSLLISLFSFKHYHSLNRYIHSTLSRLQTSLAYRIVLSFKARMFHCLVLAVFALLAFCTNAQNGSTTVGPDGFTTVPYPPACGTAPNTLATFAVQDPQNVNYLFMCGQSSYGGAAISYGSSAGVNSWRDCFALCDNYAGCTSFSIVNGGLYGEPVPAGTANNIACYIKTNNPNAFSIAYASTKVAVINRAYGT